MADLEKQNRDEILKNVINDVVNNVGTQNINKETQEEVLLDLYQKMKKIMFYVI